MRERPVFALSPRAGPTGSLSQHGHEKVIDDVRGEGLVERGIDGQLAEQAGLDHLVRERGEVCLSAALELPARDRPADDEPGGRRVAEDAQLMAEGMAPIRGQGSILEFWRTAISRATSAGARRTIEVHKSASSGELGYALCTVTVQVPGTRIASWDATVWQRGPSGEWRIAVDISTRIAPGA